MHQVDSDKHARLSREAMYYLEQDISNTTKRLDEEVDEVNSILRGIADIHASTQLDFDNFLSEKKKLVSYMDRKIDKVYEVDNNISGNEITILINAIKATQSVIETYADVTRKIEQYQPSSYGKESSVLNLGEAFYEIQKYYEKNSEEIFAAAKQQRKIDEELGITEAKEEQAEKKQNSFFSTVLSFVPVVGDAKDIQETVMGMDVVTGEKLGAKERIFTGICIVLPVVNGKAFRVGGDAAKTVKAGKVVSKATASVPIVIKITKEESGIMKLVVKKADGSGSKIVKAIENSKAQKIGDDGAEILGKKATKEAIESGSKTISDLSNKAVKHPMNDHMPARYAKQLQYMSKEGAEQYLNYKTFFNSNWTDEQVREALNSGVTTGKYSFKYLGENVTVYLEDGIFKTGYGDYVYTYDELVKLLGGE